ncbi:MAG TPA: hypothetical protein PKC67_11925 [Kiritimatiellia bacterium]|nr:hypothetical protein [Kiritimatiellia bacterium]
MAPTASGLNGFHGGLGSGSAHGVVELCIGGKNIFHQRPSGIVGNRLGDGNDLHTGLAQFRPIYRIVVHGSSKAIRAIHDKSGDQILFVGTGVNHPKKFWPIGGLRGLAAFDKHFEYLEAITAAPLAAIPLLCGKAGVVHLFG